MQTDPSEKGKGKVETPAQGTTEVPPLGEKRKDPPEEPIEAQMKKNGGQETIETQKKKKHKTSKPVLKTALTDDDYELIAIRTCDTIKESFDAMKTSQEKI